jgi:hypothetical protein
LLHEIELNVRLNRFDAPCEFSFQFDSRWSTQLSYSILLLCSAATPNSKSRGVMQQQQQQQQQQKLLGGGGNAVCCLG